jgi:hypothetical protein
MPIEYNGPVKVAAVGGSLVGATTVLAGLALLGQVPWIWVASAAGLTGALVLGVPALTALGVLSPAFGK